MRTGHIPLASRQENTHKMLVNSDGLWHFQAKNTNIHVHMVNKCTHTHTPHSQNVRVQMDTDLSPSVNPYETEQSVHRFTHNPYE